MTAQRNDMSDRAKMLLSRGPLRVLTAVAVAVLAATSLAACGGGDVASKPKSPVAEQLDWLVSEVNGDSATLAQSEVEAHLANSYLDALPAAQVISFVKQARSAYAPIRLVGFAGHPSAASGIALVETRQQQKLAIYASVDGSPEHRITGLDVAERPAIGATEMAAARRYTGAFDIGGRKMFLNCSGSGSPTVILEAGANAGSHSWFAVQPWLATTTRVCSYDRANVPGGSSDPGNKPQTAASIVSDLHRLLRAAELPGPYLFAGHSNGGLFARLYATTYPKEVLGLVLIDTGNYPAIQRTLYKKLGTPTQWKAYQAYQRNTAPFVENAADEQVDLEASYAQMAKAQRRHPLPRMPLVVISHGIPDPSAGREALPGLNKATEKLWQQTQINLATLVPGGRRIVATKSHHPIPTEQPGLIVQTIRALLTPSPASLASRR